MFWVLARKHHKVAVRKEVAITLELNRIWGKKSTKAETNGEE